MDSRFYNSSGCLSSSSGSSPDEKKQKGRAITGAHHFTNPSTIRRPLFTETKELSLAPSAPQTLFWGQMDRNQFQPVGPMPMQSNDLLPHPSHQVGPPIRGPIEPRPMVSRNFGIKPGRECKFCRNNGESKDQYSSHVLRNPNTGQLICPVLRSHVCEICGSTGDKAHTRNYCPKVKQDKKNKLAIPVILKKTMRQSDGQMRQ